MMKENVLSVTDLCAGYSEKPMVSDVTFSLGKGEIFCIVGESGCGKSTLLKAILGTTPGLSVLSGSIRLGGTELTALPQAERQRLGTEKMGVVFQNPGSSFNPIRSYKKQFIETLKSHRMYDRDKFMSQVETAFGKLGLDDVERILNGCPYEMSGGMNQRIAMAIALILGQEILLADEPTGALDSKTGRMIMDLFHKLHREEGTTIVLITHSPELAEECDRIVTISDGSIINDTGVRLNAVH